MSFGWLLSGYRCTIVASKKAFSYLTLVTTLFSILSNIYIFAWILIFSTSTSFLPHSANEQKPLQQHNGQSRYQLQVQIELWIWNPHPRLWCRWSKPYRCDEILISAKVWQTYADDESNFAFRLLTILKSGSRMRGSGYILIWEGIPTRRRNLTSYLAFWGQAAFWKRITNW